MKKYKFLIMLSLLVIITALFLVPNSSQVEAATETDEFTEGDYTYSVLNGEATIVFYNGDGGDVVIPSSLGGYPVTAIGWLAFNSNSMTSVTIPEGVQSIGDEVFYDCHNLTSVIIPNSVTSISDTAFESCLSLTDIWVDKDNPAYCNDERGVLFNKDKSMLIKAPGQMSGEYVIPDSVVSIGEDAFEDCTNLSFNIYDNAKYLGSSSNPHHALIYAISEDIALCTINENTKVIAGIAFFSCDNLISIKIPDSVLSIGDYAFYGCESLNSITIGKGVKTIGDYAFSDCNSLDFINIPDNVTSIGAYAFLYSNLISVTIGDGVTTIGEYAFQWCSVTSVTIGNGLSAIGKGTFYMCEELADISIPESVTTIGKAAFYGCDGLSSVTIPNSVTTIGDYAFSYCNSLSSVTISDGVTNIGDYAFYQCENLTAIMIPGSVETIGDWAFSGCKRAHSITIADGVNSIGIEAFSCCESLDTIAIPNSVKTIEEGAFWKCINLTSAVLPDSVTAIGEGTFSCCHKLSSMTMGSGVTTIGDWAFEKCTSLTSVTIPASITSIGEGAYEECTELKDVYYSATNTEWNAIAIDKGNDCLTKANIHFAGHIHSYTKKVTKPTCTAKGYTTYTCSCGDTYKDNYVNVTSHSYAAATCTKPKTCKVCKATSGKALGHSYKSGSCIRCKYKPAGAKITTQPVNVAVKNGKTAKVTVKATGSGLKYTWYYAKKGAKTYTKTNVTSSSYSVKMSNSINGGKVYCVVTDQYGNSVKSNVVTLYKGTAVKITTQPKSTTVANGKTGKLTIKASGSSLKYQWYIKYKGAAAFAKVGKSSKTYSFKMASKLNGAQVYCVVKDKYGIEVKSSVVTLKMPTQPKITTQPKSAKAFSGKTVKFTVKASGEGLKYQWYYAKKGSSSFKKLSAKSATYSVKVSSSVNGRKYYCLVTDKYGQTVKSSVVTLTMQQAAKITTQPKNVSVKNNKTAKVTIKATGDGLKYTWYYLLSGQTKYTKATFTGNSFSVKMSAKYKNAKVYCTIADQYGNTVKSKTVTLKMK